MRFAGAIKLLIFVGAAIATVTAQSPPSVSPLTAAAQFSGEAATTNQLVLGLGANAVYDDNAFNSLQPSGQAEIGATPRVSWDMVHSHWTSMLNYSANIMRSTRFDFYNLTSHSLATTFNYRVNKNLSFDVTDTFIHTADPLSSSAFLDETPPNAGTPNPSFLGQPAVLTSNFVNTNATYQLDARSDVSLGGGYFLQRYSNSAGASQRDSNGASGNAAFHHLFSARVKSGVAYDVIKITMPESAYETFSQRFLVTQELTLRPSMTLSLFGGPNHISNKFSFLLLGIPVTAATAEWSWSAGGTYTWVLARFNMSGSITRQVSDGGGLTSTVRRTSFRYSLGTKLPRKISASIYAGYTLNDSLVSVGSSRLPPKFGSAGVRLTRNLRRDLDVTAGYDRMEQVLAADSSLPWIDRDRVTLSINYSFTHPLGR